MNFRPILIKSLVFINLKVKDQIGKMNDIKFEINDKNTFVPQTST